jgi:hypothetical protein
MMTTKYIIIMKHSRGIGDDLTYYYKGRNKDGEDCFGFQKNSAKRFLSEDEAIQLITIFEVTNLCYSDTFEVAKIRCRM